MTIKGLLSNSRGPVSFPFELEFVRLNLFYIYTNKNKCIEEKNFFFIAISNVKNSIKIVIKSLPKIFFIPFYFIGLVEISAPSLLTGLLSPIKKKKKFKGV